MGLDVVAYEKIEPLPAHVVTNDCYEEHVPTFTSFEHSAGGIQLTKGVDVALNFWRGPCMKVSGAEYHFRAGSYSSYGEWRAALCRTALDVEPDVVWKDLERYAGRPFFELIHFSDSEGVIGPKVCLKLFNDFSNFRHTVRSALPGNRDVELYDEFQKAFALGGVTGMVVFQ